MASAVVAALLLAAGLWLEHRTRPRPLPAFDTVRAGYTSSEASLLDRNGELLQTLRQDYRLRRLAWTPLEQISPALPQAVIQAEDRRFYQHGGVDFVAMLGAVRDRLAGGAHRGASTVDMQLAARLQADLGGGSARRGLLQKLRQMRAALALNRHWSKPQLLEAYLNLVGFRGESQGVAAASWTLFAKSPAGLTGAEAWTLAALLPAPGATAQQVGQRACVLAGISGSDCDVQRRLTLEALSRPPLLAATAAANDAPQLARRLLRQPGEQLRSTLDARIQRTAYRALQAQLRQLGGEEVRDGAAVVVDNASGEVLAYVGSAGPSSRSAQIDGARALRQAGSTLKPFLYALAIEKGLLTAASLLNDEPVALEAGPGLYLPQNYEHDYKGLVSVRTALAGSLNIPAVRTLLLSGLEPFRERLGQLGYVGGLTEAGEYYGYSLALGSAEVSLLEQVNAYRVLANGGLWSPLKLVPDAADAPSVTRAVISPQAAFIVSDILADRAARAVTFDFEGPLSTPYWAAVKTGTSKQLRDNWCIGFSHRYTVGVWVGNFEGDPMRTVSGITGAAPAWREIMDVLQQALPDAAPAPPPGLVQLAVRFEAGLEPPRQEWFVAGTESPTVVAAKAGPARARLSSPANGSLIALDPDIPLARQHVVLSADGAADGLQLQLDGRPQGSARKPRLWTPIPGEHRLSLIGADGRQLDEVSFTVRDTR